MNKPVVIREIEAKDDKAIEAIIKRSLENHHLDHEGTAYTDPQLAALSSYYHDRPKDKYWVMELDGEVVGGIGIGIYNEKESICELQKLYLASTVQGKGLSRELMKTALNYASAHFKQCYLETRRELEAASYLYEKYGFQLLEKPLKGSEHTAMDRWYIKDL
ncbi:GNAT family N-acetyltransferase [Oceanobacillus jeddahense]|uniref:GNAT family N-acetyltransferase n=1 Tax=Oceanobacillus jeddahense TaxID=1462527 RepID=A0ABY5JVZ0_9BACI|nr:GNAT family N-acetyltransferase [Oceanobacillus jeddahense]UUI02739.1 GNAT family N-acetyltransferase [Oceanobacillus jeddahense]